MDIDIGDITPSVEQMRDMLKERLLDQVDAAIDRCEGNVWEAIEDMVIKTAAEAYKEVEPKVKKKLEKAALAAAGEMTFSADTGY